MIVKEILTLPPWVDFEGVHFEFRLCNDGGKHCQLYYPISYVDADSPHKMQYEVNRHWTTKFHGKPQSSQWLVLYEKIETDADLIYAIRDCWYWLQKRGLLSALGGSPYG